MENSKKRKYNMFQVLAKQMTLIKEYNKSYIFFYYFLNMIVTGVLPVIAIFIPRIIIDILNDNPNEELIINNLVIIVSIALVLATISTVLNNIKLGHFIDIRTREFNRWNERYMMIDYSHLEDPSFRDKAEVASSALNSNVDGFEGAYHLIFDLLPLIISVIIYSVIVGLFQPLIFIAAIIGAIITILVNRNITKYLIKRKEDEARARRKKNYFYNTCYDFAFGKDIRVYNLSSKLVNDYKRKSYNYITVLKQIANKKFLVGLFELVMLLVQDGLAYFFVIEAYFANLLTLGEVSLYIGAIIALSTSLRSLSEKVSSLNSNTTYTSDYFEFLEDNSYISRLGSLSSVDRDQTLEIEFKNVSFKYPNTDNYILKDFDFKIKKGEKLAIVGANGAGKSTIIKLITGLFKVTSGEILINGINIEEFDNLEYQKMFSVVFQEVNIYAGSIIENVAGTATSDDEIKRAKDCLDRVGLSEKIKRLEKGYETQLLKVIDENATELSGGENQKIAIARALFKDGNMVILDEPTAALDALAEAKIYQSFDDLVKGKTAIYISHRLSSTKFCDKIAFFTADGLKEYGNHDELMKLNGEYRFMFETQGKYYQMENEKDV